MKYLCVFLLSFVLSVPAFSQTVKFGYFEVAPYVFKDKDNKLRGATVEFLEEKIAPLMGITIEWAKNAIPIPRQLIELKNNRLDAAAVFAKNPEREKILAFPSKPYFQTNPVIAVLKSNPLQRINKIEDVLTLKIGYCTKSFVSPFMRDKRLKWDLVSSSNCISQNLKKLMVKRFSAQYQPDAPPLLYYARESKVENDIKLVSLPEEVNVYTPFSKAAGAKYVDKYEKALVEVGGTKAYLEYLSKYIDITKL